MNGAITTVREIPIESFSDTGKNILLEQVWTTEKEFQSAVVHLFKQLGWEIYHVSNSKHTKLSGFPDLVMRHITSNKLVALELKAEKGGIRAGQQEWIDAFASYGIPAMIARPSDWDTIVLIASNLTQ